MDIASIGAAVALVKNIPGSAAQRAEAAAEQAEAAAADIEEVITSYVSYEAQTGRTAAEKAQARKNIGAESISAERVVPSTAGYIAAASTATSVEVDENGDPVVTSAQNAFHDVYECAPGDKITAFVYSAISSNYRAWMFLGAADNSTTPPTRPILGKGTANTKATVYTAPAGTELVVFHDTATRIANDTDQYYLGALTDARVNGLEDTKQDKTAVKTVSGKTPSITAEENTVYKCGTLDSLSFTPSAAGLCEVIFTSGTTPTVLTLPNTVRMPAWWTGPEASTTYEISIADGVYGVVAQWT